MATMKHKKKRRHHKQNGVYKTNATSNATGMRKKKRHEHKSKSTGNTSDLIRLQTELAYAESEYQKAPSVTLMTTIDGLKSQIANCEMTSNSDGGTLADLQATLDGLTGNLSTAQGTLTTDQNNLQSFQTQLSSLQNDPNYLSNIAISKAIWQYGAQPVKTCTKKVLGNCTSYTNYYGWISGGSIGGSYWVGSDSDSEYKNAQQQISAQNNTINSISGQISSLIAKIGNQSDTTTSTDYGNINNLQSQIDDVSAQITKLQNSTTIADANATSTIVKGQGASIEEQGVGQQAVETGQAAIATAQGSTQTNTILYIVGGIVIVAGLFFYFHKKAA